MRVLSNSRTYNIKREVLRLPFFFTQKAILFLSKRLNYRIRSTKQHEQSNKKNTPIVYAKRL
jgi:hypothetical protein